LLRAIFGEKSKEVRDTCLDSHGEEGVVMLYVCLIVISVMNLILGTITEVIVQVAEMRKSRGDN
jgi:DNA-directed RNA polymerase beta subunit